MIRILKFLFTGDWHLHQWEDIKNVHVNCTYDEVSFTRYYCKCKICGTHKTFD